MQWRGRHALTQVRGPYAPLERRPEDAGSRFWFLAAGSGMCGVSWCATRLAWLASGVLVVGRAAPDRAAERRAPGPAAVDVNKTEAAVPSSKPPQSLFSEFSVPKRLAES
jgi:hypothetical protein